ncbi:hypothetical protein NQ318_015705 [Aromia moschata]|uniref:Carboxylic ester hydrolase n=1 Tax=Aromia moschata TaxID=1265417 RepID=A0AAV8YIZ3_9CUCU|nr:hypothetical protein NQ318_015705 [Aromia moschata]
MWTIFLISCFACFVGKTVGWQSEIIVTLPNGAIRGRVEETYSNVTFYAFQQIPFAEPPVGKLRFLAPQPAKEWDGVLDCTMETTICRQMYSISTIEGEDCLHLHVYTPVLPGSDPTLPVMFYIYGGGFEQGSANYYGAGPHYFMEHDVVLVGINYRTGPLGFLSTGDTVIPGNGGLKDQNLALKWVQDNIQFFGGDPKKVTIFGQSAGAASVSYQTLSKQSTADYLIMAFFRAAIAQSGAALCPWTYQRHARNIAYQFAAQFDSSFNESRSSEELLELLQSIPEQDLADVAISFRPTGINLNEIMDGFIYAPVIEVDHDDAFFTERQYEVLSSGDFNQVPLLIGICSEEAIQNAANITSFHDSVAWFESDVRQMVNEDLHITDDANKTLAGEQIRKIYTDGQLADDLSSAMRMFSDLYFTRGIRKHADIQSRFTDVYFYQFSYFGNMTGQQLVELPGAGKVGHSGDYMYQWAQGNQSNVHVFPDSDVLTHERFMKLFTDFSKYLNPTPEESELIQNLIWPKYTEDEPYYLDIDTELSIKESPRGESYSKWLEVYETYGVQPFDTY